MVHVRIASQIYISSNWKLIFSWSFTLQTLKTVDSHSYLYIASKHNISLLLLFAQIMYIIKNLNSKCVQSRIYRPPHSILSGKKKALSDDFIILCKRFLCVRSAYTVHGVTNPHVDDYCARTRFHKKEKNRPDKENL